MSPCKQTPLFLGSSCLSWKCPTNQGKSLLQLKNIWILQDCCGPAAGLRVCWTMWLWNPCLPPPPVAAPCSLSNFQPKIKLPLPNCGPATRLGAYWTMWAPCWPLPPVVTWCLNPIWATASSPPFSNFHLNLGVSQLECVQSLYFLLHSLKPKDLTR